MARGVLGGGLIMGWLNKFHQSPIQVSQFGRSPVFHVRWRALERNKYAPWGRGVLGGAYHGR